MNAVFKRLFCIMMPLPLFANSPVVINSNNGCGVCEQWQIDELNGWISDAVEEEYHKDIDSIYVFHIFHLDMIRNGMKIDKPFKNKPLPVVPATYIVNMRQKYMKIGKRGKYETKEMPSALSIVLDKHNRLLGVHNISGFTPVSSYPYYIQWEYLYAVSIKKELDIKCYFISFYGTIGVADENNIYVFHHDGKTFSVIPIDECPESMFRKGFTSSFESVGQIEGIKLFVTNILK